MFFNGHALAAPRRNKTIREFAWRSSTNMSTLPWDQDGKLPLTEDLRERCGGRSRSVRIEVDDSYLGPMHHEQTERRQDE